MGVAPEVAQVLADPAEPGYPVRIVVVGLRPPGHHLVPHLPAVLVAGEAGRRILPPQKKLIQ